MEFYQKSADLFNNDNKGQSANQCLLKIATMASQDTKNLPQSAKIFEDIGRQSLESNLGKFSAKGYLFQALLCHLAAGDNVATRLKVDEYKSTDYSFGSSRECDLVEKLLVAIESMNADDFAQVILFRICTYSLST
jgi:alpha-soluble NSF attachment protein